MEGSLNYSLHLSPKWLLLHKVLWWVPPIHLSPSLLMGSKLHELLACLTHTNPVKTNHHVVAVGVFFGFSKSIFQHPSPPAFRTAQKLQLKPSKNWPKIGTLLPKLRSQAVVALRDSAVASKSSSSQFSCRFCPSLGGKTLPEWISQIFLSCFLFYWILACNPCEETRLLLTWTVGELEELNTGTQGFAESEPGLGHSAYSKGFITLWRFCSNLPA